MTPLISVIVPVYHAENYLAACIETILRQSFSDFELILVDDGSPDGSGAMCDSYQGADSRVHVLHKENGGVSSARNAGLDWARGTYVVFVDSDDYLGENYLQDLYAAEKPDSKASTLVISDYQPFSTGDGMRQRKFPMPFVTSLDTGKNDAQAFRNLVFGFLIFPPYCKLYRRDIIEKYGIRFNQEIRTAEDFDFNCRYLQYIEQIVYISSVQYFYRVDYKKYRPSNGGILGKSEILSAHIMAHGIQEIAERMGNLPEVQSEIYLWAANKHYFNRLEMLFAPNRQIGFRARMCLYDQLISDKLYYSLAKKGATALPKSTTRRIALSADRFSIWWGFHFLRKLRGIPNLYQQDGA